MRVRWIAALLLAFPALALAQEAFTSRFANVRAGPDRSYPLVAQLPPDTPVQVMGCLSDYRWCDIAFYDGRGWVYAGSLAYPYASGPVPLLTYGAVIGVPIIAFSLGSYWDRYYRGRPWYGRRDYWASRPLPSHIRAPGPPARPGAYAQPFRAQPFRAQAGVAQPRAPGAPAWRGQNRVRPNVGVAPRPEIRPAPGPRAAPGEVARGNTRPRGERPHGEGRPQGHQGEERRQERQDHR